MAYVLVPSVAVTTVTAYVGHSGRTHDLTEMELVLVRWLIMQGA